MGRSKNSGLGSGIGIGSGKYISNEFRCKN